jgi:predicted acylesterase/phospholipase RssA
VESDGGGGAGLVLGGGGARGAYASGALSVLLRELKDQVRVIVGTSAGALISAYLAANWHRSVEEAIEDGLSFWRELRFGDVFAPLMAPGGVARFARYIGEFLPVSSLHAASILDPAAEAYARQAGRLRPAGREHPRAAVSARGGRNPRAQQPVGRLSPGRDRATP